MAAARGPLPSLGNLLAKILDASAKNPTSDHGGADVPQHIANIERKLRAVEQQAERQAQILHGHMGGAPQPLAQSEHCEMLSKPKVVVRPVPINHLKQLQMRRQREGERRLAAAQLAARREDAATERVIGHARRRLVRKKGTEASTFFEAGELQMSAALLSRRFTCVHNCACTASSTETHTQPDARCARALVCVVHACLVCSMALGRQRTRHACSASRDTPTSRRAELSRRHRAAAAAARRWR